MFVLSHDPNLQPGFPTTQASTPNDQDPRHLLCIVTQKFSFAGFGFEQA